MKKHLLITATIATVALASQGYAESIRYSARQLFEECLTSQLELAKDGSAVHLASGVVVEDDGPAAGYSYLPNVEKLTNDKRLKKTLVVDRAAASSATLLVARGGELMIRLNGRAVPSGEPRKLGNYWQAYEIDPKLLQSGNNEVVLSGTGQIWIARDDEYAAGSLTRVKHPNRSSRSTDGGKTWTDQSLGDNGSIDGEYYVRLHLDQYVAGGTLQTSVFDVGNLSGASIGPALEEWGKLQLKCDAEAAGGQCQLRVRSGTAYVPADETWSAWSPVSLRDQGSATIDRLHGRFFQLEIALTSRDPLATPRLRSLHIQADPQPASDWIQRVKVVAADNPPLARSSIPFAHQDSRHPALVELRRKYELDKLVAGAKSELEIITRLAKWSSGRWPKLGHLGETYPAWNALEILKPHRDGTPVGGFCQQFNLVFLQACQSFGIVGRNVSIGPGNRTDRIRGGHEVVEVWSNDYGKWIYVDGNTAWYLVDEENGVPLSLWELRQLQLDAFTGKKSRPPKLVKLAETRYEWKGIDAWPPLVELRMVPRSDFLSRPAPLPLNQGMRGWFWTGYHVWSDQRAPAREIYPHRVMKRANWEWSAGNVHLALQATPEPGIVRVHLDTQLPNFQSHVVAIDGNEATVTKNELLWKLHPGENKLVVTPRNKSGRTGVASSIALRFEDE